MKSFPDQTARRGVKRLLKVQAMLTLAVGIIWWWMNGLQAGYSAWIGGSIALLGNVYFAIRVLGQTGAQAVRQILRTFYVAEAVKLVLSAVLFILVFVFIPVAALPLVVSYIIVQMVFWVAPWCFQRPPVTE